MRQIVVVMAAVLFACGTMTAQNHAKGGGSFVETFPGDVVIRTDDDRVVVLLDTTVDASVPPDGAIDQWFTLQTAEPVLTPIFVRLENAVVVHTGRGLRVTTAEERYELLIDAPGNAADAGVTRVLGVGLAHNKGKGGRILDHLDRRGRVKPDCEGCLTQDPGTGGGSGGSSCPSGGPGSTSCSASNGTNECSVTCASGYYACCQALPGAAYCRCIKG